MLKIEVIEKIILTKKTNSMLFFFKISKILEPTTEITLIHIALVHFQPEAILSIWLFNKFCELLMGK